MEKVKNNLTKDVLIKKNYKNEHELLRRQIWMDAWTRTASANDCKKSETATSYADKAVEEFDVRFKKLPE